MQAKANDRVKVHYRGTLQDGTVFDSSVGKEPFEFIIGEGKVIPGFEKSIIGMSVGDVKTVTLAPEEGYGPRKKELCAVVARCRFPETINLRSGAKLEVQSSTGKSAQAVVLDVTESEVTLDLNHPLAGQELIFELELIEIL